MNPCRRAVLPVALPLACAAWSAPVWAEPAQVPAAQVPASEASASEASASQASALQVPAEQASAAEARAPVHFAHESPQRVLGYTSGPKHKVRWRRGVVFALQGELSLGNAFGYPNDARYLNESAFFGRSGTRPGAGVLLSAQLAIAPALQVGFYFSYAKHAGGGWDIGSGGGGLRLDVLPFTGRKSLLLHNLGLYALLGVGSVTASYSSPGQRYHDLSGTQSHVALGAYQEFRFGPLGIGPDLRFDSVISRSTSRLAGVLGLRISLYPAAF